MRSLNNKVFSFVFLSFLVLISAGGIAINYFNFSQIYLVGIRENSAITQKDKEKFTNIFNFFQSSQKTPPTAKSQTINTFLDNKSIREKEDLFPEDEKDSLSLSLLQLSHFRNSFNGANTNDNTKNIMDGDMAKKLEHSPLFLDFKRKRKQKINEQADNSSKNEKNPLINDILSTVKKNTAKLVELITTYDSGKNKEKISANNQNDNVLHMVKYITIILLFVMAIYGFFLVVWVLFGMAIKLKNNIHLITKTNHYSFKNSILESKEILKNNLPNHFVFAEAFV